MLFSKSWFPSKAGSCDCGSMPTGIALTSDSEFLRSTSQSNDPRSSLGLASLLRRISSSSVRRHRGFLDLSMERNPVRFNLFCTLRACMTSTPNEATDKKLERGLRGVDC